MKVIGVLLFAGCILAADREVTVGPKGQYSTVQAAVDAVPPRTVIHILPGVYKERVVVPYAKPFLTFRGDDPLTTVITNNSHAGLPGPKGPINTFATPTVFIQANDFTAQGLTFENSAGNQGQAVALTIMGDRGIFRNCRFLGLTGQSLPGFMVYRVCGPRRGFWSSGWRAGRGVCERGYRAWNDGTFRVHAGSQ